MTDAQPKTANWQPIDIAEQHVKDAASAIRGELGRSRVRIYHGPGASVYAMIVGFTDEPAKLWCRLPDFPL
jgi:hypothetical protein